MGQIDYFLQKAFFELIESIWKSALSAVIPALLSHTPFLPNVSILIFSERNILISCFTTKFSLKFVEKLCIPSCL